jgi:hypothetical protein
MKVLKLNYGNHFQLKLFSLQFSFLKTIYFFRDLKKTKEFQILTTESLRVNSQLFTHKNPVLWIHNILVRIRIRRSVLLTYRSGSGFRSGSCFFRQWLTRCQQFFRFFQPFCAYYFLKVHLQSSKIKSRNKVPIQ